MAACQALSKVLDILIATVRVAPALLKPLATLSDTTVRSVAWISKMILKDYFTSKENHR